MKILGIETSCDETSAAVVENGVKILCHVDASSADLHINYGGIVPEVAARRQIESIIPVLKQTLNGTNPDEIDAVAVTIGPGLIGSLMVGTETAKTLSYTWNKPLVTVNHMIGHVYSAWVGNQYTANSTQRTASDKTHQTTPSRQNHPLTGPPKFPALVLTVSGGHTELLLMTKHGEFKRLGGTRDDAAGEAFDKVARALGLPYPGGPQIEKIARHIHPTKFSLPRPMINSNGFDVSFSGLKTAVLQLLRDLGVDNYQKDLDQLTKDQIAEIAAEFQQAVVDVLIAKTMRAAEKHPVESIILAGGVAANILLRETLRARVSQLPIVNFFCPSVKLATDNATFIASAAYYNYERWIIEPDDPKLFKITPTPNLHIGDKY